MEDTAIVEMIHTIGMDRERVKRNVLVIHLKFVATTLEFQFMLHASQDFTELIAKSGALSATVAISTQVHVFHQNRRPNLW